ncbi:MAG: MoxR family ATPase [Syntrophomonadaceae bacterium]|jgi:MoxR-like ATPase|nr:MoxR family ATPase [Syntrophomonadaceae bacterium]NLX02060.1 MoxR family ATPase [Syntrophomonadaceae bacterium]
MSKKARRYEASTGYRGSEDYIVSDNLRNSVNIAIALQKPLLIKGEPGTGKTMLAQSIADSLDKELIIWNIKSTTKAQEGLYVYDTVQRLYDSQFGEGDVANIKKYIKLGKLGEAFTSSEPVILLIDEIDKADLEFPNDLLWELDQMSFYIPETKETIAAVQRPIVVITSNAEKELPDAFLRRCIFHYIEFPDPEGMETIIKVHHPNLEKRLLEQAMETFYMLRNVPNIQKKPSTSELIDWLQALVVGGINPNRIKQDLPFLGVLLKKNEDLDTLLSQLHGKTQTRSPNYVNSSLNRYRY